MIILDEKLKGNFDSMSAHICLHHTLFIACDLIIGTAIRLRLIRSDWPDDID